jgi:hypothetical protein
MLNNSRNTEQIIHSQESSSNQIFESISVFSRTIHLLDGQGAMGHSLGTELNKIDIILTAMFRQRLVLRELELIGMPLQDTPTDILQK